MITNWQSWAAPLVVCLTAAIIVYRLFFRRKGGCASDCGCAGNALKKKSSPPNQSHLTGS